MQRILQDPADEMRRLRQIVTEQSITIKAQDKRILELSAKVADYETAYGGAAPAHWNETKVAE